MAELHDPDLRYQARYRGGYYVVVDKVTGEVVPPEDEHYKKHKDGYLWANAAALEAARLNEHASLVDRLIGEIHNRRARF